MREVDQETRTRRERGTLRKGQQHLGSNRTDSQLSLCKALCFGVWILVSLMALVAELLSNGAQDLQDWGAVAGIVAVRQTAINFLFIVLGVLIVRSWRKALTYPWTVDSGCYDRTVGILVLSISYGAMISVVSSHVFTVALWGRSVSNGKVGMLVLIATLAILCPWLTINRRKGGARSTFRTSLSAFLLSAGASPKRLDYAVDILLFVAAVLMAFLTEWNLLSAVSCSLALVVLVLIAHLSTVRTPAAQLNDGFKSVVFLIAVLAVPVVILATFCLDYHLATGNSVCRDFSSKENWRLIRRLKWDPESVLSARISVEHRAPYVARGALREELGVFQVSVLLGKAEVVRHLLGRFKGYWGTGRPVWYSTNNRIKVRLTPVILAVLRQDQQMLELLESSEVAVDKWGWSVAHYCAYFGTNGLLSEDQWKSRICDRTLQNVLPVHCAAAGGNLPLLKKLLSAAPKQLNERDVRGWTPLFHAVFYGQVDAANYLLDKGAVAAGADGKGNTVLHVYAWSASNVANPDTALFDRLLAFMPQNSQEITTSDGRTVGDMAMISMNPRFLSLMEKKGFLRSGEPFDILSPWKHVEDLMPQRELYSWIVTGNWLLRDEE